MSYVSGEIHSVAIVTQFTEVTVILFVLLTLAIDALPITWPPRAEAFIRPNALVLRCMFLDVFCMHGYMQKSWLGGALLHKLLLSGACQGAMDAAIY